MTPSSLHVGAPSSFKKPRPTEPGAGFTLTELLVAMAIFISLMAGITILFTGSTRVSQQGFQTQEAYEIARGAMNLMQRDLSRAFASRQRGDHYSFYGTPIGFTFVGLVSTREGDDANIARVTYVIHPAAGFQQLRDVDDVAQNTYALIRLVESDVEDLDSFPVDWNLDLDGLPPFGSLQTDYIDVAATNAVLNLICTANDEECLEQVRNAKKRELWIQMLAQLDSNLLDAWAGLGEVREDYVLAENILLDIDPTTLVNPAADVGFIDPVPPSIHLPAFEYHAIFESTSSLVGEITDATFDTPIVIESVRHGLTTNTIVAVSGVTGNTDANGDWIIFVVDDDTFRLLEIGTFADSVGNDDYDGGGQWRVSRAITFATNATPIVVTDLGHGLSTNNLISISGVQGNTNANGVHSIFRIDADTFSLRVPVTLVNVPGSGDYVRGGTWLKTGTINAPGATNTPPIVVNDDDHGLASGNTIRLTGVVGNTAANGTFTVTSTGPNTFVLDDSVGNGAYVSGGTWIEDTAVINESLPFWNDTRNIGGIGSPTDPHLPQLVSTRFTLFFKSPAPGAPDFERTFTQQIDLPGGYQRFIRN